VRKIQLYADPIKDEIVHNLIDRLEEEGQNTRGYVQNQIKERLKAFELLCKEVGSNDPMEVVLACMKGVSAKEKADTPTPKPNNDETAASLEKFAEIGTSGGWMG
jgi:hypothetical protein